MSNHNCLSKYDIFRALDGIADAAALSAMLSLLSAIYPDNISAIMAVSQGLFGVGYTLGMFKLYAIVKMGQRKGINYKFQQQGLLMLSTRYVYFI